MLRVFQVLKLTFLLKTIIELFLKVVLKKYFLENISKQVQVSSQIHL